MIKEIWLWFRAKCSHDSFMEGIEELDNKWKDTVDFSVDSCKRMAVQRDEAREELKKQLEQNEELEKRIDHLINICRSVSSEIGCKKNDSGDWTFCNCCTEQCPELFPEFLKLESVLDE